MRFRYVSGILFLLLFMTACSRPLEFEKIANHTDHREDSAYGKINMEFSSLDGEDIRSFRAKAGKTYAFDYSYLIEKGMLELQFRDANDQIISQIDMSDNYQQALEQLKNEHNGNVELYEVGGSIKVQSRDNKIKIVIVGAEAQGYLKITW